MCLILRNEDCVRRVAEQDIPIIKYVIRDLSKSFISPYQECEVKLKHYKSNLSYPLKVGSSLCNADYRHYRHDGSRRYIGEGLHSFIESDTEIPLMREIIECLLINLDLIKVYNHKALLHGYIPKGAEYYYNAESGMLASSEIVYTSEVDYETYNNINFKKI